jgi:GMP synthase (glutamine-hydrolysing)
MTEHHRFLIIDGYDRNSRDALQAAGMRLACDLYVEMLERELPDAHSEIVFPSDPGVELPPNDDLERYSGVLWTGCNATIYLREPRVSAQIEFCQRAYALGIPQFGTCWGLQMAVVAAGGTVEANPRGREMGIARRIVVTEEGREHPMTAGRKPVFEAFISHVDHATELPPGATLLAGNEFTRVQAVAVKHGRGEFWGLQYHPEYTLHEMARLIVARSSKLVPEGFYRTPEDLERHVALMEALHREPDRRDLRWLLAIDDDVLDVRTRTNEFSSWIENQVLRGVPRGS